MEGELVGPGRVPQDEPVRVVCRLGARRLVAQPSGALPVSSYRHTHYEKSRVGLNLDFDWTLDLSFGENVLRGGLWYEDYTRNESRDWHKIIDSRTGYHFDQTLAFRRDVLDFRNCWLVEQPNGDFARTMARQFLFSAWQKRLFEHLVASSDPFIAAVAAKAVKEVAYHEALAAEWVVRLGDGTEESRRRLEAGLEILIKVCDALAYALGAGLVQTEDARELLLYVAVPVLLTFLERFDTQDKADRA